MITVRKGQFIYVKDFQLGRCINNEILCIITKITPSRGYCHIRCLKSRDEGIVMLSDIVRKALIRRKRQKC